MKKRLIQTTILIGTITLCSNAVIAMENDHADDTITPHAPVAAVPLEPSAQHPGGLFRKDPESERWAVQCQGCKNWLFGPSTTSTSEPKEKIVKPTDMPKIHMIMCGRRSQG